VSWMEYSPAHSASTVRMFGAMLFSGSRFNRAPGIRGFRDMLYM
jgi:hypothetical protein